MAMRKCRECGRSISTKAKACPACGAPPRKKSSFGSLLLLVLLALGGSVVYIAASAPSPATSPSAQSASEYVASVVKSATADPEGVAPAPVEDDPPATPGDGARGAGHVFAKKIITPLLKVPSSADFPWDTVRARPMPVLVDKRGEKANRWMVTGAVDAQNSFGAQTRSLWQVVLLDFGDEFAPAQVSYDDEVVFELSGYSKMR